MLALDVTDEASIASAIQESLELAGRMDVLVNNAGFAVGGFVEEVSMEEWRRQLETNFFGLVAVTKAVLPHMRVQRSGLIINVSSVSGLSGFPGYGPYAASKFAVEGFSESLRQEMLSLASALYWLNRAPSVPPSGTKGLRGCTEVKAPRITPGLKRCCGTPGGRPRRLPIRRRWLI